MDIVTGGPSHERVDAVIVGSGAGGAVAAYELANAGLEVLVLEEGGYYDEATYGDTNAQRMANLYRFGEEMFARGATRSIPVLTGRAVGGSTVINSGSCFRAPGDVLDRWGLDHAEMDSLFADVEEVICVHPVPDDLVGRNGRIVQRGADAIGWSNGVIPRNIDGCRGTGLCSFGCPTGGKQAMHKSYLPRATALGARVAARCRVTAVAEGRVEAEWAAVGSRLEVEADAVVLAAGPIHTPRLLIEAGLGPAEHVGRHLRIQPAAGVIARFDNEVRVEGEPSTLQSWYVDEFRADHGVVLEATHLLAETAGELKDWRHHALVGVLVGDEGQGSVEPDGSGGALLRYELHPADEERLRFGMDRGAELMRAAGAAGVLPLDLRLSAYHPLGTAGLGAVCDDSGKVHGTSTVHVMDASLLPDAPGVNPQLTVMALSARAARTLVAQ